MRKPAASKSHKLTLPTDGSTTPILTILDPEAWEKECGNGPDLCGTPILERRLQEQRQHSSKWPTVKLGQVMKEHDNSIPADELTEINLAGVYSFGRGLFKRGPMSPSDTSYKSYNRLVTDDFVISVPKAWEGALARVTPEFDGWFLSPVFPTFRADRKRLMPEFLEWYCKRESVWGELRRKSRGIGARRESVHPQQFLSLEIPLPPLAEQRRVVARIEELAAQIHEARTLRHQAAEEAEALLASHRRATFGEAPTDDWIPLSDYVASIENGKSPATDGRPAASDEWGVLKVGAVSFGVFDERENKALPISYAVPPNLEVRAGDFIISRANTVELVGACALVRKTRPKLMLSDKTFRFVFREPRKVLLEYMEQLLKSPPLREQIERGASGTSPTMKNISKQKVLAFRLPPFALPEQRRIVAELDALQAEVDALKRLQAETAAELDALLPAILDRAFKGEL